MLWKQVNPKIIELYKPLKYFNLNHFFICRVYDPRKSSDPVLEGGEVVPKKGARIIWTNDNQYLFVTSFTKQSERLITLYNSQDLKKLAQVIFDQSQLVLKVLMTNHSSV